MPSAFFFVLLLSIQIGVQPFLQQKFVATDIYVPSVVLIQEILKTLIGFASLYVSGHLSELKKWNLRESARLVALPGFIYAAQNLLTQTAYIHADPLIFNLLNQTKTIWSAIFVYILMGKRQSIQQMAALGIICMCGARLSMISAKENSSSDNHSFWWGVIPLLLASACSGLAGGLSQRVLQHNNRSSLIYSIELSFYINFFLLQATTLASGFAAASEAQNAGGFFRSWTPSTCIPILTNASGGLIVGLVTKHAGAVQKGFAVVGGIIITAVLRTLVLDEDLAVDVWIALPLVISAVVLYGRYPAKPRASQKENNKDE